MMTTVVAAARVVLTLVLAAAAVSKLSSRAETETAAAGLGVSRRLARPISYALAPAEVALAALLLPGVTAYAAAIGALLLLAAFTVLIVSNIRRGNRPTCACFGANSDEPISSKTVVRNAALVCIAGLPVLAGPGSNHGVLSVATTHVANAGIAATLAALGLVMIVQTAAIAALYARRKPISDASAHAHSREASSAFASPIGAGWPPGTRAPTFSVESVDGLRVSLADLLRRERPILLLFTDPSCGPCNALLPEVAEWQDQYADLLTIVILSSGTLDENRVKRDALGLRDVLVQGATEVGEAFRYQGTPGAVFIGRDGRIGSRIASGAGPIRSLFAAVATDLEPPEAVASPAAPRTPVQVPVGETAPPVRLVALDGGQLDITEYLGRMVVLLFWSPTCGYCQQIRDEVQKWERAEPDVQLVVISSGGAQASALQRFASPVLLEDDGATQRAFGAPGTPCAALLDANGRVAAPLAIGNDDTLALLERARQLAEAGRALSIEH